MMSPLTFPLGEAAKQALPRGLGFLLTAFLLSCVVLVLTLVVVVVVVVVSLTHSLTQ